MLADSTGQSWQGTVHPLATCREVRPKRKMNKYSYQDWTSPSSHNCSWIIRVRHVTYSEAASRPPRRTEAPSSESMSGDVRLKIGGL